MNFLQVLFNSLKAKIVPLWTKFKLYTNPSFVKARLVTALRQFFTQTLSIKPRHKKDYYTIFRWQVSKKLCFAVIMVIGVLSLYYLLFMNPITSLRETSDGIKTYNYNSVLLRFAKGQVNIKAKSGYIAYTGEVTKGKAEGRGGLKDKEGNLVYQGTFATNKYNGYGKYYFKNQQVNYDGNFVDNVYDGKGTLYRENGSLEYIGNFSQGYKDGEGILYDNFDNQIYAGNFSRDELIYSDMLAKSTKEVATAYTGKRTIYVGGDEFIVDMSDIDAIYCGRSDEESLNDEMMVNDLYVLKDYIKIGDEKLDTIPKITNLLGKPSYEGNSNVLLSEAVAINILNDKGNSFYKRVDMTLEKIFSDYLEVTFKPDYSIYLYTYEYNGVSYTFFTNERNGKFNMYMMQAQ